MGVLSWYSVESLPRGFCTLVLALGIGTILEWYDFGVFTRLAPYMAPQFFPNSSPDRQQLRFWGSSAVGFIARPLGGLLVGHIGDAVSRSTSMKVSLAGMALPTVLIGALPTYHMIGIASPILLVVLRLLQGLALGGEFGGAMVYMWETSPVTWQAMATSLPLLCTYFGMSGGIILVLILEAACSTQQMMVWGWRVPYLASLAVIIPGVLLRRQLEYSGRGGGDTAAGVTHDETTRPAGDVAVTVDTPDSSDKDDRAEQQSKVEGDDKQPKDKLQQQMQMQHHKNKPRVPAWELLRGGHLWRVLMAVGIICWSTVGYWSLAGWGPMYLSTHAGITQLHATALVLSAQLTALLGGLVGSWAADHHQPRVKWTAGLAAVGGATIGPVFLAWSTKSVVAIWCTYQAAIFVWGAYLVFSIHVTVPLFPRRVRATGFSVAYSTTCGVLGGMSPVILTLITAAGKVGPVLAPVCYLAPAAGVSMLCALLLLWLQPQLDKASEDTEVQLPRAAAAVCGPATGPAATGAAAQAAAAPATAHKEAQQPIQVWVQPMQPPRSWTMLYRI